MELPTKASWGPMLFLVSVWRAPEPVQQKPQVSPFHILYETSNFDTEPATLQVHPARGWKDG